MMTLSPFLRDYYYERGRLDLFEENLANRRNFLSRGEAKTSPGYAPEQK